MSDSRPEPPTPPTASDVTRTPGLDLSKIRHELRTPINHILGYCEMLQEDQDTPAAFQVDLRNIHAGGRQLLMMVTEYFDEENFETRRHDLIQLCHNLRTPVNHIIGYGELLQEHANDLGHTKLLPDLTKIIEAARQWLALMEEYLVVPATRGGQAAGGPPGLLTVGLGFMAPTSDRATRTASLSGHLLVVDDDEGNREMLARRLRRNGLTVELSSNGLEALRALRVQRFDLVLLDLVMPNLDGYQVLKRIKSDPALAEIPVIMISALDQVAGIAQCLEAGAEDYLSKPFDPVVMRMRVAIALEKKRQRAAERSAQKPSAPPPAPAGPIASAKSATSETITPQKAIFVSYASQDSVAAKRLCETLRSAGIEVWFDRNELVGGDAWDAKIRKQIKACALFIPVISANTNARLEAYFRREWHLAIDRTHDMAEEKPFLVPVVIDTTNDRTATVPEKFRQVQWTHLPGGETPPAFCARVHALLTAAAKSPGEK